MTTTTEFLARNRYDGKPDVGQRPTMDLQLNTLRTRITNFHNKMKVLSKKLKQRDVASPALLEEYQDLNEKLKAAKIEEANIAYIRNML